MNRHGMSKEERRKFAIGFINFMIALCLGANLINIALYPLLVYCYDFPLWICITLEVPAAALVFASFKLLTASRIDVTPPDKDEEKEESK